MQVVIAKYGWSDLECMVTIRILIFQISAADLANLEVTTTTVTTEKSKAPLARPEEVGS